MMSTFYIVLIVFVAIFIIIFILSQCRKKYIKQKGKQQKQDRQVPLMSDQQKISTENQAEIKINKQSTEQYETTDLLYQQKTVNQNEQQFVSNQFVSKEKKQQQTQIKPKQIQTQNMNTQIINQIDQQENKVEDFRTNNFQQNNQFQKQNDQMNETQTQNQTQKQYYQQENKYNYPELQSQKYSQNINNQFIQENSTGTYISYQTQNIQNEIKQQNDTYLQNSQINKQPDQYENKNDQKQQVESIQKIETQAHNLQQQIVNESQSKIQFKQNVVQFNSQVDNFAIQQENQNQNKTQVQNKSENIDSQPNQKVNQYYQFQDNKQSNNNQIQGNKQKSLNQKTKTEAEKQQVCLNDGSENIKNQLKQLENYQKIKEAQVLNQTKNNQNDVEQQVNQADEHIILINAPNQNNENQQKQQENLNEIKVEQVLNQTHNNQNQVEQQVIKADEHIIQINAQIENNKNKLKQQENLSEIYDEQGLNQTHNNQNLVNIYEIQTQQYDQQNYEQHYNNQNQFNQQDNQNENKEAQVLNQYQNNYNQVEQQVNQADEHVILINTPNQNNENQFKQQENVQEIQEEQVLNQYQKNYNQVEQQVINADEHIIQINAQIENNENKLKQQEILSEIQEEQVLNQTHNNQNQGQDHQKNILDENKQEQKNDQSDDINFFMKYQELVSLILEQKFNLEQIDRSFLSVENQLNMLISKKSFFNNQQVQKFSQNYYFNILNTQLMKLEYSLTFQKQEIEKANEHMKQFEHSQIQIESVQNYKQTLQELQLIHLMNNQLIEKVKELITKVQSSEFDEFISQGNQEELVFKSNPDVQRFINDLYDKTCRQRAVDIQYRPFVRQVEDFNSLKKNYNLSLTAGKELKENYCNQIKFVRGDGNCFYTAFGFQFLKYLLIKYNDNEFEQFLKECEQMQMPMKLHLSENSPEITNQDLENKMLIEFFNRLRRLRKIENLKERLNQFEKEFAAYEQSIDQIEQDGCLYALTTIFLRNYSNYAVDFHEMKDALFDRQNLLIWEKECNTNEIVIDALSRKLNLHSILILLDNKSFEVLEYQKQAENKIILLIKPGHYNIGIDAAYEEKIINRITDQIFQILNQIKTQIQEQFQFIQKSENSLMMPQLKRQLS